MFNCGADPWSAEGPLARLPGYWKQCGSNGIHSAPKAARLVSMNAAPACNPIRTQPVPTSVSRIVSTSILLLLLLLLEIANPLQAQGKKELASPVPLPKGGTLVIGFLGGWEHWSDQDRGVRRTILNLRRIPGVYAESIENHRYEITPKWVEQALDTNGNHKLDDAERRNARVIIFGQSLGGQAAVRLARALRTRGIPVLLTVQVDSVGANDRTIPDNVLAAVNLYQHEHLTFRGRPQIRAADQQKTTILANKQFHYPPFSTDGPTPKGWARRSFGGAHARMEADPAVWEEVESYIRQAIKTQ